MKLTSLVFVLVACEGCNGAIVPTDGGDAAVTPSDGGIAWSSRAPLPLPRTDHGVAAVAGRVYAFGGFSGSMLARVDAYDPATDTWSPKADMLEPRRNFASGVINGKIYVSAGMSFTDPSAVTYLPSTRVYDPATDTWTALAPCPIGTAPNAGFGNQYFGGGVIGGSLYVIESLDNVMTMHVYDPQTDAWSNASTTDIEYSETTTATIGDVLYVFASDDYPPTWGSNLWTWYSSPDTWVIGKGLGQQEVHSAFFTLNAKLYSAGGLTGPYGAAVTGAVWEYDPLSAVWTQRGTLAVAREYAGAAVLEGKVYIVGGDVPQIYDGGGSGPAIPTAAVEVGVPY